MVCSTRGENLEGTARFYPKSFNGLTPELTPWSAPPCRRFGQRRPGAAIVTLHSYSISLAPYPTNLRQVAAGQSADKAAHSKEAPLRRTPYQRATASISAI